MEFPDRLGDLIDRRYEGAWQCTKVWIMTYEHEGARVTQYGIEVRDPAGRAQENAVRLNGAATADHERAAAGLLDTWAWEATS